MTKVWKRTPIIWWSLGAIPKRHMTLKAKIGDSIQKYCTLKSSAIFSYGEHSKKYFIRLGVDSNKIIVGHNTIDEQSVLNDIVGIDRKQLYSLKKELSIPEDGTTAVYCGRLTSGKKVDVLLKAFAQVINDDTNLHHLIIIGDGPERAYLKRLSIELQIEKQVSFVGQQYEHLSLYFLLGNFCVLPGLGGLAINHAFAHSLPVICGPADGTEEDLVQNGKTGILIDEVTTDKLRESMSQLFQDSSLCLNMGKKAQTLISQNFSLENYCKRFINTAKFTIKNSQTKF